MDRLAGRGRFSRHGSRILHSQPDQGRVRRLVPAGARADHLHVALDLAARTGARHGQALGGRGVAARFRRGDPELRSSAAPRAGHSSLPHPGKKTTPLALRDNVNYNHVLHDSVVIVSVETATVPHVGRSEQIAVDDLGYVDDGIVYLAVRYGFQDDQSVPTALRQAAAEGLPVEIDVETAMYFVSEITIVLGDDRGMRTWRKRLFLLLSRTSKSPVDFFGLPQRRIVTMGSYIEL
jgi:hypothetical protein